MKKINVVTTEKACEILECSRNWFQVHYKKNLTPIKEKVNGRRIYYETEVYELKKTKGLIHEKFNVIHN